MDDKLIQEISVDFARAKCAKALDELASGFFRRLASHQVHPILAATGVVIEHQDGGPGSAIIRVHQITVHTKYSHVWLQGKDSSALGGCIEFFADSDRQGVPLLTMYFDSLGNAAFFPEKQFVYAIDPDGAEINCALDSVIVWVIKAVHTSLTVVSR